MAERPRGTVTFLFTDIASSTRLWQDQPLAMPAAYARHDTILREAIAAHGGVVYKVIGDALQAVFPTAPGAVTAALAAQRALLAEDWAESGLPKPLRVRMALHTVDAVPEADGDYRTPGLNRLSRLLAVAAGGQILLTGVTAELAHDQLPSGGTLRDLGPQRLKDLYRPEHVYELVTDPRTQPPIWRARAWRWWRGSRQRLVGLAAVIVLILVSALAVARLLPGQKGAGHSGARELSTQATPGPQAGAAVGSWVDTPGTCPTGFTWVDLRTGDELSAASRGEPPYDRDGPGTCYFLHNGTYICTRCLKTMMEVQHGGAPGRPIIFVGESRAGVILKGLAFIDPGIAHVELRNLTFSLTRDVRLPQGSFSTLSVGWVGDGGVPPVNDVVISHVTLTGDCTEGVEGGHLEVMNTKHLLLEDSIVEKFGHCNDPKLGPHGYGIFLDSGSDIVIRNNIIRDNASRGIELDTHENADSGPLSLVTIDHNLIVGNGHRDFEDGILIDGSGKDIISGPSIDNNVFADNAYSAIRFAGPVSANIEILGNTFYRNGVRASGAARSQINVDQGGSGVHATMERNIFVGGPRLLNTCAGPSDQFALRDNIVFAVDQPPQGACVAEVRTVDPKLADPDHGDFWATNPAVAGYGVGADVTDTAISPTPAAAPR